ASSGPFTGLFADDIAAMQALYGARHPDQYDAAASNDTLATATSLPLTSGDATITADLTGTLPAQSQTLSIVDIDNYKVIAPSTTLTVTVDARSLSLLDPKVSVYD